MTDEQRSAATFVPTLSRKVDEGHVVITLGEPHVDDYLAFVGARLVLTRCWQWRPT